MNLPKLTKKQREILDLLYKHRFLNRVQIQALLRHKDYKTINMWLRDLREKHYIEWIYSTDFAEKTKPAVYYLGINAIRLFKSLELHAPDELRKRYREHTRSQTYIDRCLLIADCCVTLAQSRKEGGEVESQYFYEVASQYSEGGYFHFLVDDERIHPHLCFAKEVYDTDDPQTDKEYVLEVFDATLPRYRVRKRLKSYVEYLDSDDWQAQTGADKPPAALFICPTKADMIYCKRVTKRLLEDAWDAECIRMWFATVEVVKEQGVLAGIWEGVASSADDN